MWVTVGEGVPLEGDHCKSGTYILSGPYYIYIYIYVFTMQSLHIGHCIFVHLDRHYYI